MKANTSRNKLILVAFNEGKTIASLARKYKISWARTQRIIKEQIQREAAK